MKHVKTVKSINRLIAVIRETAPDFAEIEAYAVMLEEGRCTEGEFLKAVMPWRPDGFKVGARILARFGLHYPARAVSQYAVTTGGDFWTPFAAVRRPTSAKERRQIKRGA